MLDFAGCAFEAMALQARQGVSSLVARVWVSVRGAHANSAVLELGAPRLEHVKDFCWKVLVAEVEPGLLRTEPGEDTFWRRRSTSAFKSYEASDARGWVGPTGRRPRA